MNLRFLLFTKMNPSESTSLSTELIVRMFNYHIYVVWGKLGFSLWFVTFKISRNARLKLFLLIQAFWSDPHSTLPRLGCFLLKTLQRHDVTQVFAVQPESTSKWFGEYTSFRNVMDTIVMNISPIPLYFWKSNTKKYIQAIMELWEQCAALRAANTTLSLAQIKKLS